MLSLVAAVAAIVFSYRKKRDVEELGARVAAAGGRVLKVTRVRKGSPFSDTTRGWWAWRVEWADHKGEYTAWALTTREGIKEWRE